jgi:hypothetical protein
LSENIGDENDDSAEEKYAMLLTMEGMKILMMVNKINSLLIMMTKIMKNIKMMIMIMTYLSTRSMKPVL